DAAVSVDAGLIESAAGEATVTISATEGAITATAEITVSAAACHVTINEVRVAGTGGASDEFVELYIGCAAAVDLEVGRLVYRSAAGTSEANPFIFSASTVLAPGEFLVYGGANYTGPRDGALSGGSTGSLASAGGGIGLRDSA